MTTYLFYAYAIIGGLAFLGVLFFFGCAYNAILVASLYENAQETEKLPKVSGFSGLLGLMFLLSILFALFWPISVVVIVGFYIFTTLKERRNYHERKNRTCKH